MGPAVSIIHRKRILQIWESGTCNSSQREWYSKSGRAFHLTNTDSRGFGVKYISDHPAQKHTNYTKPQNPFFKWNLLGHSLFIKQMNTSLLWLAALRLSPEPCQLCPHSPFELLHRTSKHLQGTVWNGPSPSPADIFQKRNLRLYTVDIHWFIRYIKAWIFALNLATTFKL